MTPTTTPQDTILTKFFRSKSAELRAASQSVLAPHSGLRGSHREQLCRDFLVNFLPSRYSVGRGIIFDSLDRTSRESDIVIWDDQNFPRLPEKGHTLFFADSVKCVVEVKSNWSTEEWKDTLGKAAAVRKLIPSPSAMSGLSDRVAALEHEVAAMLRGEVLQDLLITRHHIAYAALFLDGGDKCTTAHLRSTVPEVDECLPELTLLLEPGICIEKMALEENGRLAGWVGIRRLQNDALLGFSLKLLQLAQDRSAHPDNPMVFKEAFDLNLDQAPAEGFSYEFTRLYPMVHPFYARREDEQPPEDA